MEGIYPFDSLFRPILCMKIRRGGPTSYGLAEDVHAVPLEVGAHEGVALRPRLVEDGDLPRLHDHGQSHEAVAGGRVAEVNSASEISISCQTSIL